MATYSSSLAWRIPWTEEPGGYSPWAHRVRHGLATKWQWLTDGHFAKAEALIYTLSGGAQGF